MQAEGAGALSANGGSHARAALQLALAAAVRLDQGMLWASRPAAAAHSAARDMPTVGRCWPAARRWRAWPAVAGVGYARVAPFQLRRGLPAPAAPIAAANAAASRVGPGRGVAGAVLVGGNARLAPLPAAAPVEQRRVGVANRGAQAHEPHSGGLVRELEGAVLAQRPASSRAGVAQQSAPAGGKRRLQQRLRSQQCASSPTHLMICRPPCCIRSSRDMCSSSACSSTSRYRLDCSAPLP